MSAGHRNKERQEFEWLRGRIWQHLRIAAIGRGCGRLEPGRLPSGVENTYPGEHSMDLDGMRSHEVHIIS